MIGLLLLRLSTSASFPSPPRPVLDSREERGRDGDDAAARKEGGREGERNIAWGVWEEEGGLNSGRKRGRGGKRTATTVVGASCRERAEQLGGEVEESGIESGERKEGDTCWYGHERREGGKRDRKSVV